jgi:hypothetical protein
MGDIKDSRHSLANAGRDKKSQTNPPRNRF